MKLLKSFPILAALASLWTSAASACSCMQQPDWSVEKARASGAVFAEVTHAGERQEPASGSLGRRVYTVAVHRAIGLKAGGMIDVVTAAQPATCGITLAPGETRWLLLRPQAEGYGATLCDQQGIAAIPPAEWDAILHRLGGSVAARAGDRRRGGLKAPRLTRNAK